MNLFDLAALYTLENTTGRPQGQVFPQTPCKAFRQCEFVIFRASFLRPFPFRLPTEQCPSFPASLARLLSEARGSGVSLDANTPAQASQLERCNFLRLALDLVPDGGFAPGMLPDPPQKALRTAAACGSYAGALWPPDPSTRPLSRPRSGLTAAGSRFAHVRKARSLHFDNSARLGKLLLDGL